MSSKVSAAAVVYLSTVAPPPFWPRPHVSVYIHRQVIESFGQKRKKKQKGIDLPYRLYYSPIVRRHCSGSVYVSMALLVLTFRIT